MAVWSLGDVGLDSMNGSTDESLQVSNSRSEPFLFLCEESEIKIDVQGDSATLTDKIGRMINFQSRFRRVGNSNRCIRGFNSFN